MFGVAGRVMETGLSQPETAALTELKHCSLPGLLDDFNELEEIIWNPVMLPQQHSSFSKMPWEQKAWGTNTFPGRQVCSSWPSCIIKSATWQNILRRSGRGKWASCVRYRFHLSPPGSFPCVTSCVRYPLLHNKYHELLGFKQQTFIISQLPGVRRPDTD